MEKEDSFKRADRVGDRVREEIADILSKKIKDPRIAFVTVTHVVLTDDLRHARVYVSPLPDELDQGILKNLSRAAGFIRKELGNRLQLRYVPELVFKLETDGPVSHVLELLNQIQQEKNGSPAQGEGEENPVNRNQI